MIPSLRRLLEGEEVRGQALICIVETEAQKEQVLQALAQLAGDLAQGEKGVLLVLPVSSVLGLKQPS